MDSFNIFDFYQYMQEHNVILSFKGDISQEILVSIGDLLKEKLSHEETEQQVAKKVFFIFIELAQNIYRYSAEQSLIDKKHIGMGVLFIRDCESHFTIFAGNVVAPTEAEGITKQCVAINRLSPDELKRYYKKQLKQHREEGKVGAGIGLISVVRKAGNPIVAHTTVIDEKRTFLVLSVQVDKE